MRCVALPRRLLIAGTEAWNNLVPPGIESLLPGITRTILRKLFGIFSLMPDCGLRHRPLERPASVPQISYSVRPVSCRLVLPFNTTGQTRSARMHPDSMPSNHGIVRQPVGKPDMLAPAERWKLPACGTGSDAVRGPSALTEPGMRHLPHRLCSIC